MTTMLDRWHDAYHAEAPDYANCPYCIDELALVGEGPELGTLVPTPYEVAFGVWAEVTFDPDVNLADRLEDLEI